MCGEHRPADNLKAVFIKNRKMGVSFRDSFKLVLSMSGYTQRELMALVDKRQGTLSQFINGHRAPDALIPQELSTSCECVLGFDPWAIDRCLDDQHHAGSN